MRWAQERVVGEWVGGGGSHVHMAFLVPFLSPPFVAGKLGDAKKETQSLASVALQRLHQIFPADVMLPALLKALAAGTPKAQYRCVEMLLPMLAPHGAVASSGVLDQRGSMKQLLARLASLHGQRSMQLRKAVAKALLSLYQLDSGRCLDGSLMLSQASVAAARWGRGRCVGREGA